MRSGSPLAQRAVFSATLVTLSVGLLGAILRKGRGGWVGFALFGFGYLAVNGPIGGWLEINENLISRDLTIKIATSLHPDRPKPQIPAINIPSNYNYTTVRIITPVDSVGSGLTSAEQKLLSEFQTAAENHAVQESSIVNHRDNAAWVAISMTSLALAIFGAIMGELIALPLDPRSSPRNTPEVNP